MVGITKPSNTGTRVVNIEKKSTPTGEDASTNTPAPEDTAKTAKAYTTPTNTEDASKSTTKTAKTQTSSTNTDGASKSATKTAKAYTESTNAGEASGSATRGQDPNNTVIQTELSIDRQVQFVMRSAANNVCANLKAEIDNAFPHDEKSAGSFKLLVDKFNETYQNALKDRNFEGVSTHNISDDFFLDKEIKAKFSRITKNGATFQSSVLIGNLAMNVAIGVGASLGVAFGAGAAAGFAGGLGVYLYADNASKSVPEEAIRLEKRDNEISSFASSAIGSIGAQVVSTACTFQLRRVLGELLAATGIENQHGARFFVRALSGIFVGSFHTISALGSGDGMKALAEVTDKKSYLGTQVTPPAQATSKNRPDLSTFGNGMKTFLTNHLSIAAGFVAGHGARFHILQKHPHWEPDEVREEVKELLSRYGNDTATVYALKDSALAKLETLNNATDAPTLTANATTLEANSTTSTADPTITFVDVDSLPQDKQDLMLRAEKSIMSQMLGSFLGSIAAGGLSHVAQSVRGGNLKIRDTNRLNFDIKYFGNSIDNLLEDRALQKETWHRLIAGGSGIIVGDAAFNTMISYLKGSQGARILSYAGPMGTLMAGWLAGRTIADIGGKIAANIAKRDTEFHQALGSSFGGLMCIRDGMNYFDEQAITSNPAPAAPASSDPNGPISSDLEIERALDNTDRRYANLAIFQGFINLLASAQTLSNSLGLKGKVGTIQRPNYNGGRAFAHNPATNARDDIAQNEFNKAVVDILGTMDLAGIKPENQLQIDFRSMITPLLSNYHSALRSAIHDFSCSPLVTERFMDQILDVMEEHPSSDMTVLLLNSLKPRDKKETARLLTIILFQSPVTFAENVNADAKFEELANNIRVFLEGLPGISRMRATEKALTEAERLKPDAAKTARAVLKHNIEDGTTSVAVETTSVKSVGSETDSYILSSQLQDLYPSSIFSNSSTSRIGDLKIFDISPAQSTFNIRTNNVGMDENAEIGETDGVLPDRHVITQVDNTDNLEELRSTLDGVYSTRETIGLAIDPNSPHFSVNVADSRANEQQRIQLETGEFDGVFTGSKNVMQNYEIPTSDFLKQTADLNEKQFAGVRLNGITYTNLPEWNISLDLGDNMINQESTTGKILAIGDNLVGVSFKLPKRIMGSFRPQMFYGKYEARFVNLKDGKPLKLGEEDKLLESGAITQRTADELKDWKKLLDFEFSGWNFRKILCRQIFEELQKIDLSNNDSLDDLMRTILPELQKHHDAHGLEISQVLEMLLSFTELKDLPIVDTESQRPIISDIEVQTPLTIGQALSLSLARLT